MLDGNVRDQHSVLSVTFNQAVKLFSNLSSIPKVQCYCCGGTQRYAVAGALEVLHKHRLF